jgi:hypothetical protein
MRKIGLFLKTFGGFFAKFMPKMLNSHTNSRQFHTVSFGKCCCIHQLAVRHCTKTCCMDLFGERMLFLQHYGQLSHLALALNVVLSTLSNCMPKKYLRDCLLKYLVRSAQAAESPEYPYMLEC